MSPSSRDVRSADPHEMSAFMRTDLRREYQRFLNKKALFFLVLIFGIISLASIAVTLGSAGLSVKDVYIAILARFLPGYFSSTHFADTIVWSLRLNRILMGIVAGMGLSVAGAAMQGILKNPLASEFTLGMDSAACFGASLAIVLGAGFAGGQYLIVGNAFIFTLIASFTVYGLARYRGITPETLILAGIAITYLFSAMTTFLQYVGNLDEVHEVVFWMMGSLDRSSWDRVAMISAILALCLPYLIIKSWDINAISAGDETAKSLGVDVERTRVISMMLASLITASIICFTGTIGFVGLVAPHITRMVIGGDHRFLLPGSALTGALILLGADTLARTVLAPVILPVGIMTSFLGVPFFVYLFMQRRKTFW
jgi:iron complex transport system permease protein